MNNIIKKLITNPEVHLFSRFSDLGVYIEDSGKKFFELVHTKREAMACAREIDQIEKLADVTVSEICTIVDDISIMKYNHRDAVELAKSGDSIIDLIWGAADRLVNVYALPHDQQELKGISAILFEMTTIVNTELLVHIGDLKKLHNLPMIVKDLKDRENKADDFRRQAEQKLYQLSRQDTRRVVDWRAWAEVYKRLEQATDRCVDVLDIISHLYRERV